MQEVPPRFRVLIADDDCVIANTLSQILRLNGYETETVSSGEEAVATAAKRKPDILITDVVMGGITGIEAAIRILEFIPACLVILISGQANTADHLPGAWRKGHQLEILPKPVHPKVLLERIAAFAAEQALAKAQCDLSAATRC
ncbi:MAG TPA: response regulator [Terracidiphilus sp.]|nr:response regulator [Terracidiphilus sp.]